MQNPSCEQCQRQGDSAHRQEGPVEWLELGGTARIGEQPHEIQQRNQPAGQTTFPTSQGGGVDDGDQQEDRGGRYCERG